MDKVFKWMVGILLIVLTGTFLFVRFFLNPFVKNQIISSIRENSSGLYTLDIGDLKANFWTGSVSLTNVHLRQDSTVFKKITEENPGKSLARVDVKFNTVKVSRIHWINYLRKHDLEVGRVYLKEPDFRISGTAGKVIDPSRRTELDFIEVIPGIIASFAGSLKIERVTVDDGKLHYDLESANGVVHQTADSIMVDLKKILIDSMPPHNTLFSEEAEFSIKNYKITPPVGPDQHYKYTLLIDNISGTVHDSILNLKGVKFRQKLQEGGFYNIRASELSAKGLNYSQLINESKLNMHSMNVKSPVVKFAIDLNKGKEEKVKDKKFQEYLLPFLSGSVDVDSLKVSKGKVDCKVKVGEGVLMQKADNVSLLLTNVKVDTINPPALGFFDDINFSFKDYLLEAPSNNFKIAASAVHGTSVTKRIGLSGVSISQIRSYQWFQRFAFTNNIPYVLSEGFDFKRLMEGSEVFMNSLTLSSPVLKIEHDKSKQVPGEVNFTMPSVAFKEVPFMFNVPHVSLKQTKIIYEEIGLRGEKPYIISFDQSNIDISNFTNDPSEMSGNSPAVLNISSKVLGKAEVKLSIQVDLLTQSPNWEYSGNIGTIDATTFNDLLYHSALEIKQGQIYPSTFSVKVKNGGAKGQLSFIYDDLKVRMLDKKGKKKRVMSWLANFVIKDSNPRDEGEQPEITNLSAEVKKDDSFFYFMWRVLSMGIEETITKSTIYNVMK